MPISGVGVALATTGGILVYSGLENQPVTAILTSLAHGAKPAKGPAENYVASQGTTSPGALSELESGTFPTDALSELESGGFPAAGTAIAADALRYQGHAYGYGGAPGTSGADPWDCSSFVNWVLGHDLGYTLPGESSPGYAGTSHGPTTLSYLTWSGAVTVSHDGADAAPGDLAVWETHMGIATGPDTMISAQTEATGTGVSQINGAVPEFLFVRRIGA